jgi:H+/Cl- antiporter ClcA
MDIGSRLAYHLGRVAANLLRPGRLAILGMAVVLGAALGALLLPAPEPLTMAPLRWYGLL